MDKVNNFSFSKAFTLIELLVVIAIIAVLIAIFMPVLSAVMENGRTTKCASNLRQIGSAMFLYASDHNGYFPESGGTAIPWGSVDAAPPGGSGQASWMEQLSIYMGTSSSNSSASAAGDPQFANGKSIFTCPSSSLVLPQNKYYSYFNGGHAAYAVNGSAPAALKQQAITFPAKHILSGDCNIAWPGTNSGQQDADKDDYTQDPFDNGSQTLFHRGLVNLLFADGHVASIKWNTTLSAYFDPTAMATHYSGTTLDDPTISSYVKP